MQSALERGVTTPDIRRRIDTPVAAAYIDLRTSCEHIRGIVNRKVHPNESGRG
jgi:hypothetical protein